MKEESKHPGAFLPKLALFSAALIWGSSFVMMKNAVSVFPTNLLLMFRFSIACAILSLLFFRRLKRINVDYLKKAALIGFCLYLAYNFQTVGLRYTSPGKNAFLTGAYVILVPFLYWAAGKHRPTARNGIAAFVCLAGIGLISLIPAESALTESTLVESALSIGFGDALTLVCSFFYAAHMVLLALFSPGKDPLLLTILQFAYCALFFGLSALFGESMPAGVAAADVVNLLYLAVFCTAAAMFFQNYGQKYTHPSAASLIMSLESVFGVVFSVLLYHEALTPRLLAGFALVFAAILISELHRASSSIGEVADDRPFGKE
ncbi:MAG: DMT family transporter [Clostridiales bacterium]|nr:DMT family transporter [Clostridiales bacterium]